MINAKQLTTNAVDNLINNSLTYLRELVGVIQEKDEEAIRVKFLELMYNYQDNNFWYQEASILLVKLIDYIEENLGISLESTLYEGKAEKWLQHFTKITYNYTESP